MTQETRSEDAFLVKTISRRRPLSLGPGLLGMLAATKHMTQVSRFYSSQLLPSIFIYNERHYAKFRENLAKVKACPEYALMKQDPLHGKHSEQWLEFIMLTTCEVRCPVCQTLIKASSEYCICCFNPATLVAFVEEIQHGTRISRNTDHESEVALIEEMLGADNQMVKGLRWTCLLYTSPSPRDQRGSRMPSSA